MLQHGIHAPRLDHAEHHDDGQGDGHDDGLNEVHGGHSAEAAHGGIADDNDSADDDRHHIVPAEQAVEQLADGRQTGGHIGHEEHQDDNGGDAHDDGLLLPIALGDKAGDGDGVQVDAVPPQTAGHQQKVQIGARHQTDGGPAGVGHAAEIGKARDAHEQIATHVRGLGAHGGDQGAHAPSAQVKALGTLLRPASDHHAGEDHHTQVQDDGTHDDHLYGCHISPPLALPPAHIRRHGFFIIAHKFPKQNTEQSTD